MKKSSDLRGDQTPESILFGDAPAEESATESPAAAALGFLDEGDPDVELAESTEDESYEDDEDDGFDETDSEYPDYDDTSTGPIHVGGVMGITLALAIGTILVLGGIVTSVLWNAGAPDGLHATMGQFGFAPPHLLMAGVLLFGFGLTWRRLREQALATAHASAAADQGAEVVDQLHEQIQFLVENHSSPAPAPAPNAAGGPNPKAVQQILHLVERQQEKIANLSKATKMYGKPLLEITNQMSESTRSQAEISTRLEALKVILEQSTSRLEREVKDGLANAGGTGTDTSELTRALSAARDTMLSLETLQRDLSQRLSDKTERIVTDLANNAREASQHLDEVKAELATSFDDAAQKIATDTSATFEEKLTASTKDLADRMGKMSSAGKGGAPAAGPDPTPALENIQQELARLGHRMTELQLAPSASGGSDEAAKSDDSGGGNGGGGSEKKKSVQSAIEKLRQMRS